MGTAIEVAKSLVSPAEKLIEAVSGAIGKAYEPRHIRKMAEAKSYELNIIADTMRNNSDIPIIYNSQGVIIDIKDFEDLAKRAGNRLAYQEIAKQQNIEAVVDIAYDELKESNTLLNESVKPEWMNKFFNSVENVSDEEMQKLWGQLLAGEIKHPSSFSYRTMEKLKNMNSTEAIIFSKVSSLLLKSYNEYFVYNDNKILEKFGVHFHDILNLEECGLMSSQSLILHKNLNEFPSQLFYNSKIISMYKRLNDTITKEKFQIPIYVFTESGKQLYKIINVIANNEYYFDCINKVKAICKECEITAHELIYVNTDGSYSFNSIDILKSSN